MSLRSAPVFWDCLGNLLVTPSSTWGLGLIPLLSDKHVSVGGENYRENTFSRDDFVVVEIFEVMIFFPSKFTLSLVSKNTKGNIWKRRKV